MSMPISVISSVVPYIGTWIETSSGITDLAVVAVVPYIGTWIETINEAGHTVTTVSYLI